MHEKTKGLMERSISMNLKAEDVEWVVNENAELGVRIHGRCFFLYKGASLEYTYVEDDDGSQMMVRPVGKREFGECCHPLKMLEEGVLRGLDPNDPEDGLKHGLVPGGPEPGTPIPGGGWEPI